jgi:hypothetical protein
MLADLRGDMQRCLQRPHHWNVDRGASALDPDIEHAERHHRVIAFPLRLPERFVKDRRGRLDLGWRKAIERPCIDRQDADLNLSRRIAQRRLLAQPPLLRRIVPDDECNPDLMRVPPLSGIPAWRRKSGKGLIDGPRFHVTPTITRRKHRTWIAGRKTPKLHGSGPALTALAFGASPCPPKRRISIAARPST